MRIRKLLAGALLCALLPGIYADISRNLIAVETGWDLSSAAIRYT